MTKLVYKYCETLSIMFKTFKLTMLGTSCDMIKIMNIKLYTILIKVCVQILNYVQNNLNYPA